MGTLRKFCRRRVACLLTICLCIVSGCGSSMGELQGATFAAVMQSAGFEVVKDREAANSDEYVDDIEIAVKDDEYQVEMYFMSNESKATKYYADFCRIFDKKTKTSKSSSVSAGHFSYYSMDDGDRMYRIARFKSKIFVVSADKKYAADIENIIEKLGEIYNVSITD